MPLRPPSHRAVPGAPHLLRLGGGRATRAGVAAKAAVLDRLAAAGMPVPVGAVLPHALSRAHADDPARLADLLGPLRPGRTVVVRSAFGAEDSAATSAAGAYRTVTGVATDDCDALGRAVADVLASGADLADDVRRDVVVQQQVEAAHAGVAVLEDCWADDLVESVDGPGEDLVSGRAAGTPTLLPRLLAGERPRHGVDGRPLPEHLRRLSRLLRRLRRALGRPPGGTAGWDVEWVDDGRRCWVVQARPLVAPTTRDEVLTVANHVELLPPLPSTFMTGLVVDRGGPAVFGWYSRVLPDLPGPREPVVEVEGRPYLDQTLLEDAVRLLGLPSRLVTDTVGGRSGVDTPLRPLRLARRLPSLALLGTRTTAAPALALRRWDETRERVGAACAVGRRTRRLDGLVSAAGDAYDGLVSGLVPLSTGQAPGLAVLRAVGTLGEHAARTTTSSSASFAALAGVRAVAEHAGALQVLADGLLPADERVRRAFRDWAASEGHRGPWESDLAEPRGAEDPAGLLAAAAAGDPAARLTPPPRTAVGLLTWPLWAATRPAVVARERLRHEAMREFAAVRSALLDVAGDAVRDGRLPVLDALWRLRPDEVRALDDGPVLDHEGWAGRRALRERQAGWRAPETLRRRDDVERWYADDDAPADRSDRWRGLGLTRGTATGAAVVLRSPRERLPDRDDPLVLVAPAVDAGWLPVFRRVAAVVVRTGGDLSHGSVVLRELGLPAVTNVDGVLDDVVTGDVLVVDGARGTVVRAGP